MISPEPSYFAFNSPESACGTCSGLGSHLRADPRLLVRRPDKSLRHGALDPEIHKPNNEAGLNSVLIYSLSKHYGFSLETPWEDLPDSIRNLILYGTNGQKISVIQPETAQVKNRLVGQVIAFTGFLKMTERRYQSWSRSLSAGQSTGRSVFHRLMTQQPCPDCGGRRLKKRRFNVSIQDKDISELTSMQIDDCLKFLRRYIPPPSSEQIAQPILEQLTRRIESLIDVGLGYVSLDRRSDTLSSGEAQRIKLATQLSSGLIGMLYILDEPSTGLHPKDGNLIIQTLSKLRDSGNTVVVVEHDMQTIAAADNLIEMGPGAGTHGGRIVAQGSLADLEKTKNSPTGEFLNGTAFISVPGKRRSGDNGWLKIRGAAENNLKCIDVSIPLANLVCVTGVSGSGKSSLVHGVIHLALQRRSDPTA